MSQQSILKSLQFSPLIFGLLGLVAGLVFSRSAFEGLMYLGVCVGSCVGMLAALSCLLRQGQKCLSMASLVVNAGLFYVVAREFLIIS
jgi:hypothetical protein